MSTRNTNYKHYANTLTVAHINACSIRKKLTDVHDLMVDHKLNILGVSETWLRDTDNHFSVSIPGYRALRCDRPGSIAAVGGGVCLYYQEHLRAFPASSIKSGNVELTSVILDCSGSRILIACSYRSPSSPVSWWDELQQALSSLTSSHTFDEMILMGDLNVDMLRPDRDHHHAHLQKVMCHFGLFQLNNEPTRFPTLTCLDLILSTGSLKTNFSATTVPVDLSDHYLIKVNFSSYSPPCSRKIVTTRQLKAVDFDSLRQIVRNDSFLSRHAPHEKLTANQQWTSWSLSLANSLNKVAPEKSVVISSSRKRPKPWVTPELRSLYHRKKHIYRKSRLSPDDVNVREQFRTLRTKVDRLNTYLRNQYFFGECSKQRADLRLHWQLINTAVNRLKPRPPPVADITHLNSFFQSVVTAEGTDMPCHLSPPSGPSLREAFTEFTPVSEEEVLHQLMNIEASKAAGSDGIPACLLKALSTDLCPSLTTLLNTILSTGDIPQDFKLAHITPVHKKGDPAAAGNYRPISLLPIISKVMERLVLRQLNAFIENYPENEILPQNQFAYRPGHSTEDALTVAVDHWSRALDQGQHVGACFVDMSKAFDRVGHVKLLLELQSCGIGGTVLHWFMNYLDGRKQAVKIGQKLADTISCTRGVPQGSVLGPILYSIYVRDVPKVLPEVTTIQYADDICFFVIGKDTIRMSSILSTSLCSLNEFLESRSLLLNATKTQVMLMTARTESAKLQVCLNDQPIEQASVVKYLGLHIDSSLTFGNHVEMLVKKTAGLIFALRRHRRKLDIRSRRMYYLTLIQSHFEYASNAFSCLLSASHMNMLEVAANNAIRAIFGSPHWAHVSPLYARLCIAPLPVRYLLKCYIAGYKCANDLSPIMLTDRFQLNVRDINPTRQTTFVTFRLPPVRKTIGYRSFSYICADRFNGLPADLRSATDLLQFVSSIKSFIGYPERKGR